MIGDDKARNHRFAQTPARLDQPLIGAGDRVFGEHHAGDLPG